MNKKKSSNKNFGVILFIIFILIAFWPVFNSEAFRLWPLLVSLFFLILGLTNSKLLTPFKIFWSKSGIIFGKIVSLLVMIIIFFIIVTPIAIIMKLFKKDLLNLKFNKTNSYWIEKNKQTSKMKNQF